MKKNSSYKKLLVFFWTFLVVILMFPATVVAVEKNAYFAGGCFWCMEHDFEDISGVISVESGYSGGVLLNPNYENHNGHQESVNVTYNPKIISYEELLKVYWRNIDPLDGQGQFCDRGDSYRPMIFTNDLSEDKAARISLEDIAKELKKPQKDVKVGIQRFTRFWMAEDYHQDFANRNSLKYNFYRFTCGRDNRLDELWGERAYQD
mgnify:CR=1 FL=1